MNTHCEAKLLRGNNWDSAELIASFSGTPAGVIEMLFAKLCLGSPEEGRRVLDRLRAELDCVEDSVKPRNTAN